MSSIRGPGTPSTSNPLTSPLQNTPPPKSTQKLEGPTPGADGTPGLHSSFHAAPPSKSTAESPVSAQNGVSAARDGDATAVSNWLRAGGDPNEYDSDGWTPLLAAASRGHTEVIRQLLQAGANPNLARQWPDTREGGPSLAPLPIHYAGQSGNLDAMRALVSDDPTQLNKRMALNGHDLAMQLVFYHGANPQLFSDFVKMAKEVEPQFKLNHEVTTVRGLTHKQMAVQFNNLDLARQIQALEDQDFPWPDGAQRPANEPFANSPALEASRATSYRTLLQSIAPPGELTPQRQRLNALIGNIETAIRDATPSNAQAAVDQIKGQIAEIVRTDGSASLNELGGPLSQPPLVVAVTGGNGNDAQVEQRSNVRKAIVELLVNAGADPMVEERHPMAVDAFIRALVFNHLDEARIMASSPTMNPERLAEALNRQPRVNGLTGVHDTMLRASTASAEQIPSYLRQIQWLVESGARTDIPDFSGRTQRSIAETARDNPDVDPQVRQNGAAIVNLLNALAPDDLYSGPSSEVAPLAQEVRTTLNIA
jgi:hypothetical protein